MRRDLPQVPTYTPTLARTSVPRYFTISPSLAVDEQSPLPAEADLATPPQMLSLLLFFFHPRCLLSLLDPSQQNRISHQDAVSTFIRKIVS